MSLAQPAFSFDHAYFFLTIAGCDHDLSVRSLDCWNDDISEDYLFTLEIITTEFSPVDRWINQKSQLTWDDITRHGMISSVTYLGQMIDGHSYRIGFSSLFYPLKFRQQHRIYLNKTITEIITDILNSASITHFRLQLPHWQEKENYIVQFQQTDWDFLNHLLLRFGLQFIWLHEASCTTALIVDQLSLFNNHFKTLTIDTLMNEEISRLLPQQVFFDDYNPRTPSLSLAQNTQNQTTLHGLGNWEVYGSNYLTPEEGLKKTQLRQGQIDTERYALDVMTTERTCTPGQLVMIDHQTWRIARIIHQVKMNNAAIDVQQAPHYQAQLILIPPQQTYYFHHPLQSLHTNTHGVFCAKTETTGGDYAYLNEHGDYFIRQPFDASNSPPTEGSLPVRATQPHGGTPTQPVNFGMHFPLRANTEVAIGNLYGDVSRPVLLGTLANPDTPNPVNADNHTQNLMRTWRGNTLCLDDHAQKNQIHLNTPAKLNHLLLDATDDQHQVTLHTQQGQTHIEADKNLAINSIDDHILQVADLAQITVTKNQKIEAQQNLQMQSGQNIALDSQKNILLQTKQQNIALQSQTQTTIQAHQGFFAQGHTVVLNNQSGNLTLFAKNQLHLESDQALELNGGNAISMQGGNLTLQASSLHVIASTINMPKPAGSGSGGNNINISANPINFDAIHESLQPKKHPEKYSYYIVNYEGFKELLAFSLSGALEDALVDFNLKDGFEENRWEMAQNSASEINNEYQEGISEDGEFNKEAMEKAGASGIAVNVINFVYKEGLKHQLIKSIDEIKPKIIAMMPTHGGVLIQAGYLLFDDGNSQRLALQYVTPISSGTSYRPLIKKAMTGPFIESKPPLMAHWEFLFIWVVKDQS